MNKFDKRSRCCSGISVKFRWYGDPSANEGGDIEMVQSWEINPLGNFGVEEAMKWQ
jgi:hypothetical protein